MVADRSLFARGGRAVVALFALLGAGAAEARASGLDALEAELQRNWEDGGRAAIKARLESAIKGLVSGDKKSTGARFTSIAIDRVGLERGPAFASLSTDKIVLKVPSYDASTPTTDLWSIEFHGDAEITAAGIVLGRPTVTVEIKALKAKLTVDLDGSETAPKVLSVTPEVSFDANLDASSAFFDVLLEVVQGLANSVGDEIAEAYVDSMAGVLAGGPEKFGTGGAGVSGYDALRTDFASPATLISQTIRRDFLPYGTLVEVKRDGTSSARGEGAVVEVYPHGDSAIMTGQWLAAESYRYATTGEADALDAVRAGVDGIEKLLAVTGGHGYLARVLAPKGTEGAKYIRSNAKAHGAYEGTLSGRTYVWEGDPSRDQYLGILTGLSTAYRLCPDAAVQSKCKALISTVVDRLLRNGWTVGSPPADATTVVDPRNFEGEVDQAEDPYGAAFWTRFEQQFAFLLMARRVDPAKYSSEYEAEAPLLEYAWFPIWIDTLDPVGDYYKFNLDHLSLKALLTLETSSSRWRNGYRAFRILREALSHHQNAWFDAVEMSVLPPSSGSGWRVGASDSLGLETADSGLSSELRALLAHWLARPARYIDVDLSHSVPTTTYVHPAGGEEETVASTPVPVEDRPSTDFLWQRHPFDLWSGGDGTREAPGVDYILPYWTARYHGVSFGPLARTGPIRTSFR